MIVNHKKVRTPRCIVAAADTVSVSHWEWSGIDSDGVDITFTQGEHTITVPLGSHLANKLRYLLDERARG